MYSYIHTKQIATIGIGGLFVIIVILVLANVCIRVYDWWKARNITSKGPKK